MSGFDNEVVVSLGERLEPSTAQSIMLMQGTPNDVSRINFTGDPEGMVSANPSSICHDPASGTIYQKATGTGNIGWENLTPFKWNNNTAVTSVTMAPNNGYIHNNPVNNILYTLPTTAKVGTILKIIKGPNSSIGTWQVIQGPGQNIQFGNVNTTTGITGTLFGTILGDCIELVCTVANTTWTVVNSVGNLGYS